MKLQQYVRKGAFYEAVVQDGSDVIFIVDFEGKIRYHNAAVRNKLGYKSSLVEKNFFDFVSPDMQDELRLKFKQSQRRAYSQNVEFQFLCFDKSYKFLEFNAINLKHKEDLPGFILDCRDITQRKKDAEELVRLQKAKEQFLANISHEIRTPINGIAGMASLLSQNPSPEERETYLNAIKHSAENLKVIINDILDLAAIESGKLKFEQIAFNLTDLLPSLISTFTYQAKEKKIKLSYDIDPALNRILKGDPVRLNQILINLISNAVKFTHEGSINISCEVERTQKGVVWVRMEVADTGVGIPDDKLNTIFESFSQADASVTRKYGGTGLGLTIVKQLVELQKGKITVRSKVNSGSTFIVLIPYSSGKAERPERVSKAQKSQLKDQLTRNMNVLLVEDNDINRLYAKSILKNWNCNTEVAENGLVAVEKIKNNDYDVVLMDVQMPVMDGLEATRAIRSMTNGKQNVPIIALTANATQKDVEKCSAAGTNDYLPKPFTPADLFKKIFEDLKIVPARQRPQFADRKPAFDLTYLKSMSQNNEDFIREMMETFVQTLPPILDKMEKSASDKEWDKVAKLSHQIKPSLALLGMNDLRLKAGSLEEKSKEALEHPLLLSEALAFINECRGMIPALREYLD